MKFGNRILVFAAIPGALFTVALAVTLTSLLQMRQGFADYIDVQQAITGDVTGMYAAGLQQGQALRNMVLDPSNPQAGENLRSARSAYDAAAQHLATLPLAGDRLQARERIEAARVKMTQAQERVIALIGSPDKAIAEIVASETPAWRVVRGQLLKLHDDVARDAVAQRATVDATASRNITLSIALALAALACGIGFNLALRRSVQRELGGDLGDVRDALRQVAGGDLSTALRNDGAASSVMAALDSMQTSLQQLVGSVRGSAQSIALATDEIAIGSQDLSDRTERQASSLEMTASSSEQLGAQVKANAQRAMQANGMASEAVQVAHAGGQVMNEVVSTMGGIIAASKRIGDIIGVIDGIAFQTNILALNAAVEAARAGEQGRGFAVVAGEVRSLAGRSAEAAKEIKTLIADSLGRVERGSQLVDQAGQKMAELVAAIEKVTQTMGEITTASHEQALGVQQVGEAVAEMDRSTQQNAALVEEMAAAAANLKSQAGDLVQAVAVFKLAAGGMGSLPGAPRALAPAASTGAPRRPTSLPAAVRPSVPASAVASPTLAGASQALGINLDNAIRAHADWRSRLRTAAAKGDRLDADTVGRDDCCELGKWLHGEGGKRHGAHTSFAALIDAHRAFHVEAGKVASTINGGETGKAERMLDGGTPFASTSSEVARLIVQLKREIGAAGSGGKAPARPPASASPKPLPRKAATMAPAPSAAEDSALRRPAPGGAPAASSEGDWETF